MTTLATVALIALFILGAPIFAVMIGFTILGAGTTARASVMDEFSAFIGEIGRLGTGEPAQILSTIPLFILAGYLMAESRTADRVVRVARAFLGWLPGGLAVVTILACALFTTFTGASGVTIVALGGLLMPSLLKERYSRRFSLGLIAGTGSVGLLFPPALPLFVYGTVYGVNDQLTGGGSGFTTDRFLFAGIVPGLVLVGLLCLFAIGVAVIRGIPRHEFDIRECGKSLLIALPEIALPFLIIGALANGVVIPEVASLTVLYVLLIETVVYRDLDVRSLWRVVRDSMALVGAIFIIVFAASAMTGYSVTANIPSRLVEFISEHVHDKWMFLLALNLFLILVGMMMDIFSAIVIVVPLITPLAKQYGIDPFHLGVIFLLNLEIGYLTPPVGLNLFITGFKFHRPIMEVIRSTVPFLLVMLLALGLVTYIPALTVVPDPPRNGRLSDIVALVRQAKESLATVDRLTMPDGTVTEFADCKTAANKLNCEELFATVTTCRKQADGKADTECERKAVADYVELATDSWDTDWDDEEADGDGGVDDGDDAAGLDDDAAGLDDGADDDDDAADDDDDEPTPDSGDDTTTDEDPGADDDR